MRVYIAGPMTGIPKFNIPAFDALAGLLRQNGHDVVSPAELDGPVTREYLLRSEHGSRADYPPDVTWGDFLSRDVKLLVDDGIEALIVLPGWANSMGARLEVFVAHFMLGLPVLHAHWPDNDLHLRAVSELSLIRNAVGNRDITLYKDSFR